MSKLPDYEIIKTFKGESTDKPKDCFCKGNSKPDEHFRLALDLDKNKDYPNVMAGMTVIKEGYHKAKKYNYKLCVQKYYMIRFKDVELTLDEILVSSKTENYIKDNLDKPKNKGVNK